MWKEKMKNNVQVIKKIKIEMVDLMWKQEQNKENLTCKSKC